VGQIANSLVFDADGAPLLVMTSGAHRVDTGKVAAIIGAERVRRATPEFVRAATGQAIGGVAPVGHPAPMRTLVGPGAGGVRRGLGGGRHRALGLPHHVRRAGAGHRRRTGRRRVRPSEIHA
jgi:prolyl-tRNA editing enzyme YbaK/EbsC (Cys-tRNA(Pro) deacylase)